MAGGRWAKAGKYLLVAIGAAAVVAGLTWLALEIDARLARGPLAVATREAKWIAAGDSLVVIGLGGPNDTTHRVISVDPKTMQMSELQAGNGSLGAFAHDHEWLYWSSNGTYVMPMAGGPIRKVSDRASRSIGIGAGRVYFSLVTWNESSRSEDDDEIWSGTAGQGPERKVAWPPDTSHGVIGLLNGFPAPLACTSIAVDDSQAVWVVYENPRLPPAPWGKREEEKKPHMQRVQHGQSVAEKFVSPCGFSTRFVHTTAGSYFVCGTTGAWDIVFSPKDRGPRRALYTLPQVKDLREHEGFLYVEAKWVPASEEWSLLRIPVAGGPAQTLVRSGHGPFAVAAGRLWYTHPDGVASLPLPEG